MKKFEITENLAAVIQNYLATRPLRETYDMFNALSNLKEIPQAEPASDEPKSPEDNKPAEAKKPKAKSAKPAPLDEKKPEAPAAEENVSK
jgi:hypothetical protein